MTINKETCQKVRAALEALFQHDKSLFNLKTNERSISHKLAEHLQRQFPNLDVDCEYNRHGCDIKLLRYHRPRLAKKDRLASFKVYPDIVVHTRRKDNNNLLVIELKKSNSGENYALDLEKLKAFTGTQFGYRIGLFVLIDVEQRRLCEVRLFSSGRESHSAIMADLMD